MAEPRLRAICPRPDLGDYSNMMALQLVWVKTVVLDTKEPSLEEIESELGVAK